MNINNNNIGLYHLVIKINIDNNIDLWNIIKIYI